MSDQALEQARSLYEDGAFRACHDLATENLAVTPDNVEWLRLAGRSGVELGTGDAVAQLQRVAKLRPDADAWRDLGDALMTEGNSEAAGEAFRKVLELSPDDESALTGLGHLAYARGDTDEGTSLLSRAAEEGGRTSSAVISLVAMYRALGRPEEALVAARQVADAAPEDVAAALDVAELALEVGRLDEVAQALARIRQGDDLPDSDVEAELRRGTVEAALESARERGG